MGPRFQFPGAVIGLLLFIVSVSLAGEIYRWTDEKGTLHFTDDISKIPARFIEQATKIEVSEDTLRDDEERNEAKKDEGGERVKEELREMDRKVEARKKVERRISAIEREMKRSEDRLKEIEQLEKEDLNYYQLFKDQRRGRWVPVASPYEDEKRRLEGRIAVLQKEMNSLQEKLSEIIRSLN
jgi:hypothetical protein